MRYSLALLFSLICSTVLAQPVSTYPEETTPAGADLLYLIKTPGGAGTSRKVTVTNLAKGLPAASATVQGVVTTGDQVLGAGVKTFVSKIVVPEIGDNATTGSGNYLKINNVNYLQGQATGIKFLTNNANTVLFEGVVSGDTVIRPYSGQELQLAPDGGDVVLGGTAANARYHVNTGSASKIGQIIQLAATPTASALEVWDSVGTARYKITSDGKVVPRELGSSAVLGSANRLSFQEINGINTQSPLIQFQSTNDNVVLFRAGLAEDTVIRPYTSRVIKLDPDATGTTSIGGGTGIAKVLSATATLDFPDTILATTADLTITVTGATVGDVVSLGVPNGSVTATSNFTGWVSSDNTVTVRFSHIAAGNEDPASGTFRAMVTKF